jgi:ABC-type oligopeptide transport system substrate-binding subunit
MRKKTSPILWAAIASVLAVAVVGSALGAAGGNAQGTQTLRESIAGEPPSLDPGLATDTTSANILLNIMDPLVRLGAPPELKAVPGAAQSWTQKGTTVTLNLRKDVRWTNGQPVTAADYVWSWLRTISPELAADYAYQFSGIKGADAYNSCDPAKTNCNALRSKVGVKAVGKYRLQIQLTSPQPWFIQQLSHHSFSAVHKATVTKYGNKWTEAANIVTSGPFKLSSWKHDASLTLVKNTKWRNASSVKLNRIVLSIISDASTALNAFKAGNIDVDSSGIQPADIKALKKTPFLKIYKALATYYYGVNVKNVSDVNQRRAMAFAMDRKAITKFITQLGQQPARGFTPIGIAGGPTILKKSFFPSVGQLAKAKAYMAKVKNPKKDIRIYINNVAGHINIATAVQAYWKELGLNVDIKVMEWKQYLEFLGPPPNADVDVYRLGWVYDYPDAQNGLVLWTCDSGNNNTNWCNKKFDGLIDQANRTADTAKRYQLYQQAENIISGPTGDVPLIPIYWYVYSNLVQPKVKGYVVNPMDQTDYTVVSIS